MPIGQISAHKNETVLVRGRIHTTRKKGGKLAFLKLRQRLSSCQVVVAGPEAVKVFGSLARESVIEVLATVSPATVNGATVNDCELQLTGGKIIAEAVSMLPVVVEDAMRSDAEILSTGLATVGLDTRLDHRVLDLRTPANHAIFVLQGGVCQLFREYMSLHGFTEIHTPKLLAGSSEGGSSVFKLKYFGRDCSLAQSPQLYKQMAVIGGLERVFEVGPVFRAEASDTHRHLCEFTGLDFEMEIRHSYREVMETLGRMFIFMFNGIRDRFAPFLDAIRQQLPFEPLVYPADPVIVPWVEGIRLLREAGGRMGDFDDLTTENERLLGRAIREKYNTDLYILDGFPAAVRPFYTQPNATDPRYSLGFDCFLRGEEITSGAQRVSDYAMLDARSKAANIVLPQPYLDAFKFGAPPHGGAGVGLERVVMLYLNLGNVRKASLFPRDPLRLVP